MDGDCVGSFSGRFEEATRGAALIDGAPPSRGGPLPSNLLILQKSDEIFDIHWRGGRIHNYMDPHRGWTRCCLRRNILSAAQQSKLSWCQQHEKYENVTTPFWFWDLLVDLTSLFNKTVKTLAQFGGGAASKACANYALVHTESCWSRRCDSHSSPAQNLHVYFREYMQAASPTTYNLGFGL
jgi:hypothetical protein